MHRTALPDAKPWDACNEDARKHTTAEDGKAVRAFTRGLLIE